jgi:hypothetical protein
LGEASHWGDRFLARDFREGFSLLQEHFNFLGDFLLKVHVVLGSLDLVSDDAPVLNIEGYLSSRSVEQIMTTCRPIAIAYPSSYQTLGLSVVISARQIVAPWMPFSIASIGTSTPASSSTR